MTTKTNHKMPRTGVRNCHGVEACATPKSAQFLKVLLATLLLASPMASLALTPIADSQLSGITGQALLTADYIKPGQIAGDPNAQMPIGFYRMGLDAIVEANVNINKLQLGCGGFNNNIKVGCDIDLDYVSMMGLAGPGSVQPAASGTGGTGQKDALGALTNNTFAGAPATSGFIMNRPYVTIAVANPEDPLNREVVGFKFGAQSVSGYMGIGRIYQNGEVNKETGETCNATNGQSLGCHSGLNALSGYMHVLVSGAIPIQGSVLGGAASIGSPSSQDDLSDPSNPDKSNACFGATDLGTNCSAASTPAINADISGTRTNILNVVLPTHAHAKVTALGFIPLTMDLDLLTNLKQNLRFIHGFATSNTGDFFLSFQRQQVAWPKYDKSGYAVIANAGWWMNIPKVSTENLKGATLTINESGVPTTLNLQNLELKSVPPINCFGSYYYC